MQGVAVGDGTASSTVATGAQVLTANGTDVITDFANATGNADVLGIAALLRTATGAGGNIAAAEAFVTGTAAGIVVGTKNVIVITDVQGGGAALTAAEVNTLAAASSTGTGSGIIVFNNNGTVQVWYDSLIGTATATTEMAQIATLTGVNLATIGLGAGNFA